MDNVGFAMDEAVIDGVIPGHSPGCSSKDMLRRDLVEKQTCEFSTMDLFSGIAIPAYGLQKTFREVVSQHLDTMPSLHAEEAALLGLDDMELRNIILHVPITARVNVEGDVRVHTENGDINVAVQGDRNKPVILTYHDLGLNYLCFQAFFNYVDMRALLENFCVFHVTAPGQEDGAPTLPEDLKEDKRANDPPDGKVAIVAHGQLQHQENYSLMLQTHCQPWICLKDVGRRIVHLKTGLKSYVYPTIDELANQINYVMGHFGINSFIGFGIGAGANILARFALNNPRKVDLLALINCTSGAAGWIEWAYQKMNSRSLRSRGMTQAVLDYLMWHHFGRFPEERSCDLVQMYRTYFTRSINPTNLSMFIDSYVRRTDLGISRDSATIKVPVLNITGALSPHVEDTVRFNGRLNPNNSTWMKISDSAMVLEEQPGKVSEAFRLFLQGEGFVAPLSPTKIVAFRRLSDSERRRSCRHSPVIRITENPISEAVVC